MSSEPKRFNRQELIVALEKGWKHYLPCLAELSEDEQVRYAREQGFPRTPGILPFTAETR